MIKNYRLVIFLIFISQRLFFVRGGLKRSLTIFIHKLIDYNPSKDIAESKIKTIVNGVPFFFYFDGMSETKQIFGKYNKKEINFLKRHTVKDSVFVDIGANIGFYTQNIAATFNKTNFLKIIAIEPNPILVKRLGDNISLLKKNSPEIEDKIIIENYAIGPSSKDTHLELLGGYGNASINDKSSGTTIEVKMLSLLEIIKKNEIDYITNLKIDIEGYEDKALKPFFENAPKSLYPKNIVIEYTSKHNWEDKEFIEYLLSKNYHIILKTRGNLCLSINNYNL